jgi:signal transduction histidine kinase
MVKTYSFEMLGLVSKDMDPAMLNIIELSARMLDAPASFVSVLDHQKARQFFSVCTGLPPELEQARQTPIEHSICRFVQEAETTVVIPDLLADPRTQENPLVHHYGLRAYIGVPIHTVSGKVAGALCCMKDETRNWTQADREILERLAICVDDIIKARALALEERKANDLLRQKAIARAGFVAHISHEIRTPLTGIIGSIRLLNSMNVDGHAGELISLLNRSSVRLLDVVNDTLELAKLDANRLKIVEAEWNLGEIARDVLETYQGLAETKGVALRIADGLGERLYRCDRRAVESVLHNLFGNAVKFTQQGEAAISLHEDDFGQVIIGIMDTGIGIPKKYHKSIFDEFEQAGPRIARSHGGTGLGMAIVKRLVELMDGHIALDSQPGQGTHITVTLPLEPVSDAVQSKWRH